MQINNNGQTSSPAAAPQSDETFWSDIFPLNGAPNGTRHQDNQSLLNDLQERILEPLSFTFGTAPRITSNPIEINSQRQRSTSLSQSQRTPLAWALDGSGFGLDTGAAPRGLGPGGILAMEMMRHFTRRDPNPADEGNENFPAPMVEHRDRIAPLPSRAQAQARALQEAQEQYNAELRDMGVMPEESEDEDEEEEDYRYSRMAFSEVRPGTPVIDVDINASMLPVRVPTPPPPPTQRRSRVFGSFVSPFGRMPNSPTTPRAREFQRSVFRPLDLESLFRPPNSQSQTSLRAAEVEADEGDNRNTAEIPSSASRASVGIGMSSSRSGGFFRLASDGEYAVAPNSSSRAGGSGAGVSRNEPSNATTPLFSLGFCVVSSPYHSLCRRWIHVSYRSHLFLS